MNTTTKKAANSIVGKITAGILATAAVAAPAHAAVLVVGDSLEVGSGPYLRSAVPGVRVDAVKGRTSTEGVRVLADRLSPADSVVVFPLGTNDSPSSPSVLAADLDAAARLAGSRCMVVATLVRPPGVAALNRVVLAFAERTDAQVVDWAGAVRAFPTLVGPDGVHSNGSGYALRASLIAEAVDACRSGGGGAAGALGGIPAPRNPHARPPAPAAALGAPAPLSAVAFVASRAAGSVVAALRSAATAATKAGPEPVLGAP